MDHIDLGFVEKCKAWKLKSRFFPNKIGGKPAWLDLKHLPTAKDLACKNCDDPCIFLCQVYAPYENNITAFHRTIFVFICKNDNCCKANENRNLRVLRSQLPRENQFYPFDPPEERKNWRPDISAGSFVRICHICALLAPSHCAKCKRVNYCCRQHQIFDWKNGHKEQCGINTDGHKSSTPLTKSSSQSIGFSEFELTIQSDTILNERINTCDINKEDEMKRYEKLVKNGKAGTLQFCDNVENDLSEMAMSDDDEVFTEFQNAIQYYPHQVLRYNRGGLPLYISYKNQASDIPKCENCNGQRQFEFQIMPQLLNYLNLVNEVKSLDWGIMAIFTCKNSCDIQSGYCSEYIWKQDLI